MVLECMLPLWIYDSESEHQPIFNRVMKKTLYLLLICPLLFSFSGQKTKNGMVVLKDQVVDYEGLYWSKSEVSNSEYKEFLMGLINEGRADLVPQYAPDFSVWERIQEFNYPYGDIYFGHEAFAQYPVVGVSYEAAQAFCEWKTRQIGDKVVVEKGKSEPTKMTFRLPTEAEWMAVARGESLNDAFLAGGYAYPRDHKGYYLFNHKLGEGDYAGIAGRHPKDFEGFLVTGPVISFPVTSNGVYNIAGNVSEMVAEKGIAKGGSWYHLAEDCKIESRQTFEAPTSWLGFRYVLDPS